MVLSEEDSFSSCRGLIIFDGMQIKEIPFVLPTELSPCSGILDAIEHKGRVYLLLNSKGQYVAVRSL